MSDKRMVYAEDAIDAFEKELSAKYNKREYAIGFIGIKSILENVPPAQPTQTNTSKALDCVSRSAAIDALADYIHNIDKVYSTGKLSADDCKDAAKSVLDDLPPHSQS